MQKKLAWLPISIFAFDDKRARRNIVMAGLRRLQRLRPGIAAKGFFVQETGDLSAVGRSEFFLMSTACQGVGERGERIAEGWLVARGWQVLERRFRSGHRDIDLVMQRTVDGGRLVAFVEVKTRVSAAFGGPLAAVQWRKQREMAKAARDWMSRFHRPGNVYRFDVVGVVFGGTQPEVVHIENAFAVR